MQAAHPSLTVKRLMVMVAVAAVLCGSYVWYRAALGYRKKASAHRYQSRSFEGLAKLSREGKTKLWTERAIDGTPEEWIGANDFIVRPTEPKESAAFIRRYTAIEAKCRSMAHYHDELRRKWAHAASHPWETVSPDPPPPLPLKRGSDSVDFSY